jgi:hypothetical protein
VRCREIPCCLGLVLGVALAGGPVHADPPTLVAGAAGAEPARAMRLIYTATLVLDVDQPDVCATRITQLAHDAGGYVSSRTDGALVVRVPQSHFQETLTHLAMVGDVVHRAIDAKDSSALVVDIGARLKNARAVRERLTELLRGATATKDVLEIERQLARVTGEIEDLEGSPHVIADLVAYPTVTVTFGGIRATCDTPFTYDERGLKHFKSECL